MLIAIGVLATIDYFWEWPWSARSMMLGLAAIAGWVLGERAWRRWIRPYQLVQAAADAEAAVSEFAHRLRTAHDYQQESSAAPASPLFVAALHRETTQIAEQTDWDDVVDLRPLALAIGCGVIVMAVLAAPLVSSAEFRTAAGRALLLPLEYTTVTYTPHESTVRQGESVQIAARVEGRPISNALLRYRPAGSQEDWTAVELEADSQTDPAGEWTARLDDLQHDLEFTVVAGPRPLPTGFIHVKQPLKLEQTAVRIVPPEYTKHASREVDTLDLKVLEGSQLDFRLTFNRPASMIRLQRVKKPKSKPPAEHAPPVEVPFVLSAAQATATLADLRHSVTYRLEGTTDDGISLDPVQVRIRVQLDHKPQLRFLEPAEELTVLPTTEVPMVIEAKDDLGLQRVGIQFQIGSGPLQTLWESNGEGTTEPVHAATVLMLEEHGLTFRDAITYFAFAEDNHFGQPRRTTTPLRFIDIRPYKLEFQLSDCEGNCKCSGALEELIARQRQGLSRATAALEPPRPTGGLEPLAKAEADLRDKTEEFASGMAQLGAELPTVNEAVEQMQAAVEALEADQLESAVTAEHQALASLIAARELARRKLSQSKSASQCQKFDRDQRQKLRTPEKKQQDQQQKLAQIRSQLDQLAKREQEWSKQAAQCQNPSQSQSSKSSQSKSRAQSQSQAQQAQSQQESQQQADQKQDAQSPSDKSQPDQQSGESPSPEELANRQRDILEKLAELNQHLDELKAASSTAKEMQENARNSLERGLDQLQEQRGEQASQAGSRAADQLRELSEHLGIMNSRDFGKRLQKARQQAQELAALEQAIEDQLQQGTEEGPGSKGQRPEANEAAAGERLAREQRSLATRTDALSELLEALQRDAGADRAGIRGRLGEATAENPPQEIAGQMRQTADDLTGQRLHVAKQGASQSRRQLEELSHALEGAEREFAQPQLDELLELEQKLAELLKQMQRGRDNQQSVEQAAGNWQDLERRLGELAEGDQKLSAALRNFQAGPKPSGSIQPNKSGDREKMPTGFHSWIELGDWTGMREVTKALQVKIQEAILAGALQDSDEPVPAAYKSLVEKYYRTLSDDLR
jgi:hypothetical protein